MIIASGTMPWTIIIINICRGAFFIRSEFDELCFDTTMLTRMEFGNYFEREGTECDPYANEDHGLYLKLIDTCFFIKRELEEVIDHFVRGR